MHYIAIFIYFALYLYQVVNKPIWTDEFLHYALGAYQLDELDQVLEIVNKSTKNINHGQTGFYLILDWVLLNLFGANYWALRAPSVASLILVLVAINMLANSIKASKGDKAMLLLLYLSNYGLMQYLSEARPYFPMASATLLAFAYFFSKHLINSDFKIAALVATIWGSFMHPYFTLNLYIIFITYYILKNKRKIFNLKSLKESKFDITLVLMSSTITLLLSYQTWLFRGINFDFDPFQWVGNNFRFIVTFLGGNLPIAPTNPNFTNTFLAALFYGPIFIAAIKQRNRSRLKSPLILTTMVFLTSAVISLISFMQSYWILPRQWLASSSIVTFLIFWAILILNRKSRLRLLNLRSITYTILIFYSIHLVMEQVKSIEMWGKETCISKNQLKEFDVKNKFELIQGQDWVKLANSNVTCGGKVWVEFRYYYEMLEQ